MKGRSSISNANWSVERENWYQKECDEILYRRNLSITIDEKNVYLTSPEESNLLLTIDRPKAMWFEIWLKLKEL